MTTPLLRLVADDLTGALDTAAELTGLCGPVPVRWDATVTTGSLALATNTRDVPREVAVRRARDAAAMLEGATIAFRKIDSLLRGHPFAELAAGLQAGRVRSVVLAPAFPAQGRVTRGGVQHARDGEGWRAVGDIAAMLAAEGLDSVRGDAARPLPEGISVFDAGTEDDLRRVVACGEAARGPVLWCGSGGLGRALGAAGPVRAEATLRGPVLGLFGSDHPVTARQLQACGDRALRVPEEGDPRRIAHALSRHGAALVSLDLAPLPRDLAAQRIARSFARLTQRLDAPGTLLVAGGETLAGLCAALGAEALEATGLVAPGVPRSVMRGGRWDGVAVVSKSGAFGADGFWRDLLARNGFIAEMQTT
ncbi:four-carbon acid sugar kinase family protein [Falsiroseomonas sp. HW251]|uniref:four-carbon acid sugar kinase family protein n=1 Tax=Falsiroseomonas sp. HW251 TaxID=3390998 RepID=UPI003D31CCE9